MNSVVLWNWLKKNNSLLLHLMAIFCLALALGRLVRGTTWSLFMPVALAAALGGWWAGKSSLTGRGAAGWLLGLGIPGLFLSITGMVGTLRNLLYAGVLSIAQGIPRVYNGEPVDLLLLNTTWSAFSGHFIAVLSRLGAWIGTFASGETTTDPLANGLVWSIVLWLAGSWSGWHLRRRQQALRALAPGGVVLAVVLDYTGREIYLAILYLAIMLVLSGLTWYGKSRASWERRGVDYSESIAVDSAVAIISITMVLTSLAAATPSLSWKDLVDSIREANREGESRVAESLGLDAETNVAASAAYRSGGLPRQHLLGMPPEVLEELVLTVKTGELPPLPGESIPASVNRYYWRTITYDAYTSAGWLSSPANSLTLPANVSLMEPGPGHRVIRQQVKLVSDQDGRLYWAGTLIQVNTEVEIAWRTTPPPDPSPVQGGDMLGALAARDAYNVVSSIPQVSAAQLRATEDRYPEEVAGRYLRLPETVPERVLAKARELTATAPTPYDRALAIETYLRGFPYTLEVEPPPPGRDIVDYFLFTAQKGYCDYYASAMVVLARAAGLPARIVIGYSSGGYNWSTAQYEVRQKNAHSWPEIYFPGIGWVEFEPTAGLPEITHEGDQAGQQPIPGSESGKSLETWVRERWRMLASSLVGQILLWLVGFAAMAAIWQTGEIWILYLTPDAVAVQRLYSRLESVGLRLLPRLPGGHTPRALQTALTGHLVRQMGRRMSGLYRPAPGEIANIVGLYEAQVYSKRGPGRPQVIQGIKAWARLRWRLQLAGWRKGRSVLEKPQGSRPKQGS
jgi:transglutaminase-like putative cysteine protease